MRSLGYTIEHRLCAQIHDESGETIVETLVSILVSALALLLLSIAIGSAVDVVIANRDFMNGYYEGESQMVASDPTTPTPVVSSNAPLFRDNTGGLATSVSVHLRKGVNEASNLAFYEVILP